MTNVFVRNAFVGNAACAVNMKHKGELKIENLCSDNPSAKISVCDGAKLFVN